MWPFRKPRPTVTSAAYVRWLRAMRPPWLWFLRLSEMEQEHIASLGDAYAQECIEVGQGVAEDAAKAQRDDMDTLGKVAAAFAEKVAGGARKAPVARSLDPALTMAGLGQRREAAATREQPSFLGRQPDGAAFPKIPPEDDGE